MHRLLFVQIIYFFWKVEGWSFPIHLALQRSVLMELKTHNGCAIQNDHPGSAFRHEAHNVTFVFLLHYILTTICTQFRWGNFNVVNFSVSIMNVDVLEEYRTYSNTLTNNDKRRQSLLLHSLNGWSWDQLMAFSCSKQTHRQSSMGEYAAFRPLIDTNLERLRLNLEVRCEIEWVYWSYHLHLG